MYRYLQMLWIMLRASVMVSLQYRMEFAVESIASLLLAGMAIIPLMIVDDRHGGVGGWSFFESIVVLGFFVTLKSFIEGAVNPGLLKVLEQIRSGTFDFVLLKPADAQFLVATSRYDITAFPGAVGGIALIVWGLHQTVGWPTIGALLLSLVLLVSSLILIHSIWVLVVSSAIRFVRVDNLVYLFTSLFDAARWPSSVFRGGWAILFTVILPLGLMTTWPAAALLQRLTLKDTGLALIVSSCFAVVARRLWIRSLARYTSASS